MMGLLIVILLIIILWYLFDFNLYLFGIITIINIFVLDLIQSDFVSDFDFKILPNKMNNSNLNLQYNEKQGGSVMNSLLEKHTVKPIFYQLPHDIQKSLLVYKKFPFPHTYKGITVDKFSRILTEDDPRKKYELATPQTQYKPQIHWGQLKLMLSEVEFLTLVYKRYKEANDTRPIYIVYAGSAPGDHMPMLADMFPMMQFELYDPNEFKIKEIIPNINTYTDKAGWFTDEVAELWKDDSKYVCFISDIRTFPANNETIIENMTDQRRWWDIIKPELSMFKFRLPWTTEKTEYMEGDIYLQVYPPITSTETRLIVKKDAPIIKYDNTKYEEQCYYHNMVTRNSIHNISLFTNGETIDDINLYNKHIDACYDCMAFIYIVKKYMEVIKNIDDFKLIMEKVSFIENNIVEDMDLYVAKRVNDAKIYKRYVTKYINKCSTGCITCSPENYSKEDSKEFNRKRMHSHDVYKKLK